MNVPATPSDRPRVLFVGRGAPWVGGAGYLVRQAMFLEAWARVADVTAAMFGLSANDAASGVTDAGLAEVVALPEPERKRETRWPMLRNDLLSPTPRNFRGLDNGPARAVLAKLDPLAFDAVCVYRIDTAVWAGLIGRLDLLLDIDDPEHARVARRIETLGESPDARSRRDLAKLRRFERDAARQAAVSFVCQELDRDRFPEPRPEVAPNAVPCPDVCPEYAPDPDTLLFVGNLDTPLDQPNAEGLVWFVERVWPRVRAARPGATLRVGGKVSAAVSARLDAAGAGLRRLGFLDDMGREVRRAAVNLAPIRFGTGTRIKVLDALAHGGAVVATPLGVEGLGVADGREARLASEPSAFAAACVGVLNDPAAAATMARAGHALVRRRFSTAAHVPRLAARFAAHLARPAAAGGADPRPSASPA